MGTGHYILDAEGNPIVEPDVVKWGRWFNSSDRYVAKDEIGDIYRIATGVVRDDDFPRRAR